MRTQISTLALSLVTALALGSPAAAAVVEKTCKCRDSSSGSYLELHSEHDDGRMAVMRLETFTMAGADNAAKCKAAIKREPQCGGAITPAAPPKKQTGVKIATVKPGGPFSEIGLEPGDLVTTINGQAATSDKDLAKIFDTAKNGGKVDLNVLRRGQSLQLWFEFPKPAPKAEGASEPNE